MFLGYSRVAFQRSWSTRHALAGHAENLQSPHSSRTKCLRQLNTKTLDLTSEKMRRGVPMTTASVSASAIMISFLFGNF